MLKSKKIKAAGILFMTCMVVAAIFATAFAATPSEAKDSVVVVAIYDGNGQTIGWGSGFAIGEPGKPVQYIVTNCHVAEPRDKNGNVVQSSVKVFFSAAANKFMSAEVYWKNRQKDLAVLKLPEPTTERKAMVFCPIKKINMDDNFAALGYPAASMKADFIKFDKSDISITKGGISKQVRINETDCYLLDLQISEGNSGGPIVNSDGEVVGINTFYIVDKAQNPNGADVKSSYAVTIDELMKNIDREIIPYTVKGEFTQLGLLYAGIAAVVVILIVVFVILLVVRKKNKVPGVSYVPASEGPARYTAPAPAAMTASAVITGVGGPLSNRSYNINKSIIIGRDPNRCGIAFPVDTPGVSGVHCELSAVDGSLYLKDLNSSYGTFLANGTRLNPNVPVKVNAGARFYLGGEDNIFEVR